jgi:hypothetical protein
MTCHSQQPGLVITPDHNFDLLTARRAATQCRHADAVCFDLCNTEWVNSEAIAFMLRLHLDGTRVSIRNAPLLFHRAIRTLQLQDAFAPILSSSPTDPPGEST